MAIAVQMGPMTWIPFRLNNRALEWGITESPRYLHVRSADGRFAIRSRIIDDAYTIRAGENAVSIVTTPNVLGAEFPLGEEYSKAGFRLGGDGAIFAMYGIIHTDLVRSCIERWSHRKQFRNKRISN